MMNLSTIIVVTQSLPQFVGMKNPVFIVICLGVMGCGTGGGDCISCGNFLWNMKKKSVLNFHNIV